MSSEEALNFTLQSLCQSKLGTVRFVPSKMTSVKRFDSPLLLYQTGLIISVYKSGTVCLIAVGSISPVS